MARIRGRAVTVALTTALALAGCAELSSWLNVPEKPLFEPTLEKPKAVVFFELDGAMVPFICGGDKAIARDKACAGRVPVGARLDTLSEGLEVTKAAYRDCGAGDALESNPKPPIKTVGLWTADGRTALAKPRNPSELATGEWQRLSPRLTEEATKALGGAPAGVELISWLPAQLDEDPALDLLLMIEATPAPGSTTEIYRAVIIESGADKRPFSTIVAETKKTEPPLDLITAVDVDGDGIVEVISGGDVWTVSKSVLGKRTDIASWYCYKPRPPVPGPTVSADAKP